jgi:NAD(P)H-flavin reductase/ferredoxin
MRKTHRVVVNGSEFTAYRGDSLLNAAVMNGIHIPHDCRAGQCGTCTVRIVSGELFGNGVSREAMACQCRIMADVEVAVEEVPDVTTTAGLVTDVKLVAPSVFTVAMTPNRPLDYLPGQYYQVQFQGFSARCYSPTVPMEPSDDPQLVHLHVRRVPGGRVSSALGVDINKSHRVKLTGPFGSAYLRFGQTNRLILVAGGTGFAPIWSIAEAAIRENPGREVVLVVGARSLDSLYMIPALWHLAGCSNTTIIPVLDKPHASAGALHTGSPADYVPTLFEDDIVYVAGSPRLVEAVQDIAEASGAYCYADPFLPSVIEGKEGLWSRATDWLRGNTQIASPPTVPLQRTLLQATDATLRRA